MTRCNIALVSLDRAWIAQLRGDARFAGAAKMMVAKN
jgi:hypothetical protein